MSRAVGPLLTGSVFITVFACLWFFVRAKYPFWSEDDSLGGFLVRLMLISAGVAVLAAVMRALPAPQDSYYVEALRTKATCERCRGLGKVNTWNHRGITRGDVCPGCGGEGKTFATW